MCFLTLGSLSGQRILKLSSRLSLPRPSEEEAVPASVRCWEDGARPFLFLFLGAALLSAAGWSRAGRGGAGSQERGERSGRRGRPASSGARGCHPPRTRRPTASLGDGESAAPRPRAARPRCPASARTCSVLHTVPQKVGQQVRDHRLPHHGGTRQRRGAARYSFHC
jgi:hypothetical protein